MFGLSVEELEQLSEDEIAELNQRMEFVRLSMPSEWLAHADELRKAAEVLWSDRDNRVRIELLDLAEIVDGEPHRRQVHTKYYSISRPYLLLTGFVLENLIKGILVSRDPSHITTGELSSQLRSHKILSLLDSIPELDLDDSELRFCAVAESAIPYWGRYPIPLKQSDVMPEVGITDELRASFLSLFSRLSQDLYDYIKDGWDSGVGSEQYKVRDRDRGDEIDMTEPFFDQ